MVEASINCITQWDSGCSALVIGSPRQLPRLGPEYQAVVPLFNTCNCVKSDLDGSIKNLYHACQLGEVGGYYQDLLPVPVVPIYLSFESAYIEFGQPQPLLQGKEATSNGTCSGEHHEYQTDENCHCAHPIRDEGETENAVSIDSEESTPSQNGTDGISKPQRKKCKKRKGTSWTIIKHSKNKKGSSKRGEKGKVRGETQEERCLLVPGDFSISWKETDEAAFTVGLYLFGKDFCALQRFMPDKLMKDILCYYYGSFYGTPTYRRWAGARRNGGKKVSLGISLVSGWRQEELMRRLFRHVPMEARTKLSEVASSFNKKQLSLESFISKLKSTTGIDLFVQCIGLGCTERDLTTMQDNPVQHFPPSTSHIETSAVKALRSLTPKQIMEILTGGSRLSKTKAQDLFWEAVWPCLLGKGWHSEANVGASGLHNHILFLRANVKEFAKGLVKGKDYFYSVSEVLSYIAGNPSEIDPGELENNVLGGI